jgi:hypothetical protein
VVAALLGGRRLRVDAGERVAQRADRDRRGGGEDDDGGDEDGQAAD